MRKWGWLALLLLAACDQYNDPVSSNMVKTCAAACPGGVKSVRSYLCECYPQVQSVPDAGVAKDVP